MLFAYLTGDLAAMDTTAGAIRESSLCESLRSMLLALCELRRGIRALAIDPETLKNVENLEPSCASWTGETQFVLSLACEAKGDYVGMREHGRMAAHFLEAAGLARKSVKALFNSVVAESRVRPEGKYLIDYNFVIKRALRAKAHGVAAMGLHNISREFQKIGALALALKFANRAITLLGNEFGSLSHYLAVVHRCHLFLELGRVNEAALDLELAASAGFPEIKTAVEVLQSLMKRSASAEFSAETAALTPGWTERLDEAKRTNFQAYSITELGALENRVVGLLRGGAKDKFELAEGLYGKLLNCEVSLNRLKRLLNRLRKKCPDLLVFESGKYRICDEVYLDGNTKEAG